jgi:hypothetical protein
VLVLIIPVLLGVNIDQINNSILDTKGRVIRTRCITEINKENLSSSKDLLNVVDELRHIDGIKDKKRYSELLGPLPSN